MNPWLVAGGTAALLSERGRHALRRGAVYAVAGAITAGEAVTSAAKSVANEAESMASSGRDMAGDLVDEARRSTGREARPAPGHVETRSPARKRQQTSKKAPVDARRSEAEPASGTA